MRPSSYQKTVRERTSTLELINEKERIRTLSVLTSKKRSKSCCTNYTVDKNMNFCSGSPKSSFRRRSERNLSPQQKYKDQSYFYKNLHNQKLWNWKSPMEYCEFKKSSKSRPCKVNLSVLERFRDYMEKRVGKRVPLVVEDILKQTENQT